MTPAAARPRHGTAIAVLTGAGAYPLAVASHPATEPALWPLLVTALAAAAARAGAGRGGRGGWRAAAVLLLVGAAADVGIRALTGLATGDPFGDGVASGATLAVGGLVASAWLAGARLATRMAAAVGGDRPAGEVRPVAHDLLAGGCLVLAAAGWVHWGAPPRTWAGPTVALAVAAYAAAALAWLQRLRRAALAAAWARTGRAVNPAVAGHWARWVVGLLAGVLGVVSLWWAPPVEPVRDAARDGAPRAVAWLQDYVGESGLSRDELRRDGAVAGESMPGPPTSTEEERRQITVRSLVEWLLQPATEIADGEPPPDAEAPPVRWGVTPQLVVALAVVVGLGLLAYRRVRQASGRRGRAAAWLRAAAALWARLRSALAALLRRRASAPAEGGGADAGGPVAGAVPPRRSRRWRRPSAPREQVKYDYLRVLRRAERRGLGRHRAQSPAEYAGVLHPALPDHADEVDELTSHFVEARYSRHPIDARAAEHTQEASRTLRRALKSHEPAERGSGG